MINEDKKMLVELNNLQMYLICKTQPESNMTTYARQGTLAESPAQARFKANDSLGHGAAGMGEMPRFEKNTIIPPFDMRYDSESIISYNLDPVTTYGTEA